MEMTDHEAGSSRKERRAVGWAPRLAQGLLAIPAVGLWLFVAWFVAQLLLDQDARTFGDFLAPIVFGLLAILATLLAYVPFVHPSKPE